MTLRPFWALAATLALSGCCDCPCEDTQAEDPETDADADSDTDSDADTDADSDTDADADVFEPYMWSPILEFGVVDGAVAPVGVNGETTPPSLMLYLFEEEYLAGFDDAYSCVLTYRISPSSGSAFPASWTDWLLDLTLIDDTCGEIDTADMGSDPTAWANNQVWEYSLEALDEVTLAAMRDNLGADFMNENAAYLFGANLMFNGQDMEVSTGTLPYFGLAYAVSGGVATPTMVEAGEIGSLPDALYLLNSLYMWGF